MLEIFRSGHYGLGPWSFSEIISRMAWYVEDDVKIFGETLKARNIDLERLHPL
jgi:hypothetical protein